MRFTDIICTILVIALFVMVGILVAAGLLVTVLNGGLFDRIAAIVLVAAYIGAIIAVSKRYTK